MVLLHFEDEHEYEYEDDLNTLHRFCLAQGAVSDVRPSRASRPMVADGPWPALKGSLIRRGEASSSSALPVYLRRQELQL
jgi:hypothetical protein